MILWSGLLPNNIERANEMGTSELHITSIMLAATALKTDRSMHTESISDEGGSKASAARKNKHSIPQPCGRHRVESRLTGTDPRRGPDLRLSLLHR